MNTFIFSIFHEETFGVSLASIPSQILLYDQIFLLSDGPSLALLNIKTPWGRRYLSVQALTMNSCLENWKEQFQAFVGSMTNIPQILRPAPIINGLQITEQIK